MIDTDKYEGHTEGPWEAEYGDYTTHVTNSNGVVVASVGFELDKDGQLIADAPLLLAEVKRLRDLVEFAIAAIDSTHCYMGEDEQVDLRDYLKRGLE